MHKQCCIITMVSVSYNWWTYNQGRPSVNCYQLGPMFKGPRARVIYSLDCWSTFNTLQVLQRTALGSPNDNPAYNWLMLSRHWHVFIRCLVKCVVNNRMLLHFDQIFSFLIVLMHMSTTKQWYLTISYLA